MRSILVWIGKWLVKIAIKVDKFMWKWISRIPTRIRISHHYKARTWVNGKEVEPNSPLWKSADRAFNGMDKRFDRMHERFGRAK